MLCIHLNMLIKYKKEHPQTCYFCVSPYDVCRNEDTDRDILLLKIIVLFNILQIPEWIVFKCQVKLSIEIHITLFKNDMGFADRMNR